MNSVESAASLFGSDAGPDPFAALGSDNAEATTTQSTNDDLAHSSSVFHYNGTDQNAANLFGPEDPSASAQQWSEPTSQDSYAYDASAYSQHHGSGTSYDDQHAQGWHDEQGQWQTNQYLPTQPAETAQQYTSNQHPNHSNPYDPYAPQAKVTPVSSYVPPVTQQPVHTQPTYTSYQPSTSPSTATYTPTHGPTHSIYSPRVPSGSYQQAAPESSSSYPYPNTARASYAAPAKPTPSVPPPPAPSAAVYRPKTLNAYDPPLPPPKPSKRAISAARSVRAASPAVGQQTYPLPPPAPLSAQYAGYAAPRDVNSRSSHVQNASVGGFSTLGYEDSDPWNSNSASNHYGGGVGHGSNNTRAGIQQFAQSGRASSQYISQSGTYTTLGSPPRLPHSGNTDETPTPRPVDGSYNLDVRSLQSQPQSQPQSAPPSQKSFGVPPHAETYHWTDANTINNGTKHEDVFAGTSSSPPIPSDDNTQYFSGNTVPPSGQEFGERTVSPARAASQPWYTSPRTSPDSNRGRKSNTASPSPSNHAAYRSNSYDPKVARRNKSPGNESIRSRNGSQSSVDRTRLSSPSKRGPFAVSQRTMSPGAMSNGSSRYTPDPYASNLASQVAHAYDPGSQATLQRTASPPSVAFSNGAQTATSGPYSPSFNAFPKNAYEPKQAEPASPPSLWQGPQSNASDPYAPPKQNTPYMVSDSSGRSVPNGSAFSSPAKGQYAPTRQTPYAPPQFDSYPATHSRGGSRDASYDDSYNSSAGQELLNGLSTRPPYAPSPSLLGSNDPLGRTSARVPVLSFGFGGKIVTCFHGSSTLSTGFDVALSSRQSTDIQICVLHKIIPESALDTSSARYPGPLFSDPGLPTNSLVRTTASQVKAKKASISKYLDERADEIQRGIGYLNPGSEDRRQADGKVVLVRLLKVMVENDGKLTGTPQIDATVRAALLPRLAEPGPAGHAEATLTSSSLSFSSTMPDSYSNLGLPMADLGETPISVSTLRPSALVKIQEFLLRGERRHAYHFALDEKLWAHAMIIASSIDKEAWKEVVNEFLRSELGVKTDGPRQSTFRRSSEASSTATNGREWLRVAYSLFSGQGPAAIQELLSPNQLSKGTGALQLPTPAISHVTPMSPNFPPPTITSNVPVESLSKWPETAAVMVSSPMVPDTSAALTALGDYLISNGWVEAAHACYLLSPITSPMGGIGSPSARLVLLGSRNPLHWPTFHKDPDPIIFSEIAEFALSLATPPKGQEPFHGLPHLQAYRLIRATSLAEIGHVDIAKRYCEAITNSLGRSSPYFTTTFVDQLGGLSDRLVGAPDLDKSGSWIGSKMNKPSLDGIGGWLEGRLTKFIAGDGDASPVPSQESARGNEPGVFSHYSTISSATTSASPSPQPTQINGHTLPGAPPRRSGSAMASYSNASAYVPIDRASSAMEYSRPDTNKSTSSPRVASAGPATTTFAQTPSFGQVIKGYGAMNGHTSHYGNATVSSKTSLDTTNEETSPEQESPWWGTSYPENSSAPTPTAAAFVQVDDAAVPASSTGFISLMDDHQFATPSPPVSREPSSSYTEEEDEEDLGFGNSKKRAQEKEEVSETSNEPEKSAAPERPDAKPVQAAATTSSTGSSWLGRLWRRSESATPRPVRASLGEETSFYYDKELKRWVNKKAGADAAKPAAPPPPPSRAQTASPGRSAGMQSTGTKSAPPPARSASAVDLGVLPPGHKPPSRVRSNLVPSESPASPDTPPQPGSGLAPPPPPAGRPKSSASKRNIRSRYVDILQESA